MVGNPNLGQRGVLSRGVLPAVAVGLVCVAVALHGTGAAAPQKAGAVPRPHIVRSRSRSARAAGRDGRLRAAPLRHRHWRLERPRVIVEHYTAADNFASAYATFATRRARLGAARAARARAPTS